MSTGGPISFDKNMWPQGMLRVAKMIQQIRSGSLFLVEEQELHLEARAIRRFMNLLAWLATPQHEANTMSGVVRDIEERWLEFVSSYHGVYFIKDDAVIESRNNTCQFFIASHSPVLIREFLAMGDRAAIFQFDAEWMENGFNPDDDFVEGG